MAVCSGSSHGALALIASADFRALSRLWRHSTLSRARKLEIFNATVTSHLTYGLAAAWLNVSERRRLNGFQNRCLRSIWGIMPAFISRISNQRVLETTGQRPSSHMLAKQQLLLFGKAARAPEGNLLKDSTFCPGSLRPATERFVRKVGRPRIEWTGEVGKIARRVVGANGDLESAVLSAASWRGLVTSFCKNHVLY